MALQLTCEHQELTIPDAYHKVISQSGSKNGLEVLIGVATNKAQSDLGRFHYTISFTVPGADLVLDNSASDKNNFTQIYNWMKVNPINHNGTTHDYSTATTV